MSLRAERGRLAEQRAEAYLCARGLKLVRRNFRSRVGEIDLILRDGQTLVFVEVRARASSRFGTPAETVTPTKRRRIWRTAEQFLQELGGRTAPPCRFDVVSFSGPVESSAPHWLRNAFEVEG